MRRGAAWPADRLSSCPVVGEQERLGIPSVRSLGEEGPRGQDGGCAVVALSASVSGASGQCPTVAVQLIGWAVAALTACRPGAAGCARIARRSAAGGDHAGWSWCEALGRVPSSLRAFRLPCSFSLRPQHAASAAGSRLTTLGPAGLRVEVRGFEPLASSVRERTEASGRPAASPEWGADLGRRQAVVDRCCPWCSGHVWPRCGPQAGRERRVDQAAVSAPAGLDGEAG